MPKPNDERKLLEDKLRDLMKFTDEQVKRTILKNVKPVIHDVLLGYWKLPEVRDTAIKFLFEEGIISHPLENVYEYLQSLTLDSSEPRGVHLLPLMGLANLMRAYLVEQERYELKRT